MNRERQESWLDLVAQTAGLDAFAIARIELQGDVSTKQAVGVVVQVQSSSGEVLGAARWSGRGCDLREGIQLDIGFWQPDTCDACTDGSRVVAWRTTQDSLTDPMLLKPRGPNALGAAVSTALLESNWNRLDLSSSPERVAA